MRGSCIEYILYIIIVVSVNYYYFNFKEARLTALLTRQK